MKSTPNDKLHVAIIMDGNGRWARERGLPRVAGHQTGYESVRRVVEAAPDLGIGVLTLYAFSSDNWKRPAEEIATLMELLGRHLVEQRDECLMNGVRVRMIGRRDRLSDTLRRTMEQTELETGCGRTLELRIAVDYSARAAITAGQVGPDVDLLIRTGGEKRLSDFLLWECAYAELYFTDCKWPDFGAAELEGALADFHSRERRFGGIQPEVIQLGRIA
jgi:undecaprenyl diphosphate synthase